MQSIEQALREVQSLHERLIRSPAPEIAPHAFLPLPFGQDPVAFAIGEVTRLKELVGTGQGSDAPGTRPQWVPPASIYLGDTGMSFVVEVPGMRKEDLEVTVASGELVVRGRREPGTDGQLKPLVMEQAWGTCERRFPLPPWADADKITARCALGVLEIAVARSTEESSIETRVQID